MKMLRKGIFVAACLFGTQAMAQSGELLVTAVPSKGGVEFVFELLSEGDVVGVQYDINFGESTAKSAIGVGGCVGSKFAGSQLAGCKLRDDGTVRVGIIGEGLSQLASGEVGRVAVAGLLNPKSIVVNNVALVSSKGQESRIEAVTDFSQLKGSFNK